MKLIALLVFLLPATAKAQSGAFVTAVNNDTIAVETFTRSPTQLEGELALRMGGRIRYSIDLTRGLPSALRMEVFGTTTSSTPQTINLTFSGDTVPFVNLSFALVELLTTRLVAGQDSLRFPVRIVGGGALSALLRRTVPNSAVLQLAGIPLDLKLNSDGRIMSGGVSSQGLTFMRTSGDAPSFTSMKRDYSAPANAQYSAENVTIPTPTGHTLAGTLTLPKSRRGPVPVVVTISGSGGQDRDESIIGVRGYRPFVQFAESLAEAHVGLLRYDDRGIGESTGDPTTATTVDFADDTRAILDWLRTRPDVDPNRLFLLGHSEGAMIAPMVAATDTTLRGIILLSAPAHTGRRILDYQKAELSEDMMKLPWVRWFVDYDPLPVARRVQAPVLILHGETDRQVTADQAPLLAAAYRESGNQDVTVHIMPGINHLFLKDVTGAVAGYGSLTDTKVPEDVLALIRRWTIDRTKLPAATSDRAR